MAEFDAVHFSCFTARGERAADKAACLFADSDVTRGYGDGKADLHSWCEAGFREAAGGSRVLLVFVGAAGIAVRTIAPFLQSKVTDAAVVCMDDAGRWCIPLAGGHLGGANRAAELIADASGPQAVITTSTDNNGIWAVGTWAKEHRFCIENAGAIKNVSGALLAQKKVYLASEIPLSDELAAGLPPYVCCGRNGAAPEPADIMLAYHTADSLVVQSCAAESALYIVPPVVVLGIGCRRGVNSEDIAAVIKSSLVQAHINSKAVCCVCSIDLKADEAGLRSYAESLGVPFKTYSSAQLASLPGVFTASAFVEQQTGVDNVCERAALYGAQESGGGRIVLRKCAAAGVTAAAAVITVIR